MVQFLKDSNKFQSSCLISVIPKKLLIGFELDVKGRGPTEPVSLCHFNLDGLSVLMSYFRVSLDVL